MSKRRGEKPNQLPLPDTLARELSAPLPDAELQERNRISRIRTLIECWEDTPDPVLADALFEILENYLQEGAEPPRILMQWTVEHWRTEPARPAAGRPATTDDLSVAMWLHAAIPHHPNVTAAAKAVQAEHRLPYGPRSIINRYKQVAADLAENGQSFDQIIAVREILENASKTPDDQP